MVIKPGQSALIIGDQLSPYNLADIPELKDLNVQKIDVIEVDGLIPLGDLRLALARTATRPYGEVMLFWLNNAHLLDEPKQNTLLKYLEEPHSRLVNVLVAKNAESIIDTIRSRVTTIHMDRNISDSEPEFLRDFNTAQDFLAKSTREIVLAETEKAIRYYRQISLNHPTDSNIKRIDYLDKLWTRLSAQTNQKMTTNLFLLHWYGK